MSISWEQVAVTTFVSTFVAGLFLLAGYYFNHRLGRAKDDEQIWQRVGMPVINSADDLIARIFDIAIRGRQLNMDTELKPTSSEIYNPSKELSTVWRLMHFFAAATYLEQHVADEKTESKIANLRYYANNKTRIPLKGNMFNASFPLQTEGQQLIGSKVLSLTEDREIRNVDFFQFVQRLKTDDELLKSAEACRQLLKFSTDLSSIDGQFLCVAQFTIYLIDLVQDLRPSSKWEEFRLFLVSLIKSHNTSSANKSSFLYQRGDLKTNNYFDTYNLLPVDRPGKLPFLRKDQAHKRSVRLKARANTGFPRQLTSDGVSRKLGQQEVQLRYADSPGDIKPRISSLFA